MKHFIVLHDCHIFADGWPGLPEVDATEGLPPIVTVDALPPGERKRLERQSLTDQVRKMQNPSRRIRKDGPLLPEA